MQNRKSIIEIFNELTGNLIQDYTLSGNEGITEVKVSSYLFNMLVTEAHVSSYPPCDRVLNNPPTKLTLNMVNGPLIFRKDLSQEIKIKQNRADALLKEIEDLKKRQYID